MAKLDQLIFELQQYESASQITHDTWQQILEQIPHFELVPQSQDDLGEVFAGFFPVSLAEVLEERRTDDGTSGWAHFYADGSANAYFYPDDLTQEMICEGSWADVLIAILGLFLEIPLYPHPMTVIHQMMGAFLEENIQKTA